ncbi:MAG TPA: hypothetical protein VGC21_24855 [Telluria sp.]|jgi:hypothetical protein
MQRWNWILSADVRGRWLSTQGYAEVVEHDDGRMHATLRYHAKDGGIYQWIEATIDGDGVEALVRSPNPDVPAFRLGGTIFEGDPENGVRPRMMLLTDGTTVLSLAYGPDSHSGNYD